MAQATQTQLGWMRTGDILVIQSIGKGRAVLNQNEDQEKFEDILTLLEDGYHDDVQDMLFEKENEVIEWSDNNFYLKNDQLYLRGDNTQTPIPHLLSDRIEEAINNDVPCNSFINFWKRVLNNPDSVGVESLYEFLVKNSLPITNNGTFFAYKNVVQGSDGKLYDGHTRSIEHYEGAVIQMKRENVEKNREVSCSSGLHVASHDYNFPGEVSILVEVDPFDVVSVPYQEQQKMRVCRYFVKEVLDSFGKKAHNENNRYTIDLTEKSAPQIVDEVKKHIGKDNPYNLKSKSTIKNWAVKELQEAGFNVTI